MTPKTKAKAIYGVLTMFIALPMWLWIIHEILERVDATQLMWFLYWVYVPLIIFLGVIRSILDAEDS